MNQLLNPAISFSFLKHYMDDPGRLEKLNKKQLQQYRNRALRKIISYASTVPLYQEKFADLKIQASDIKGIHDLKYHPFITKNDLRTHFPDKILPQSYPKDKAWIVCTGGTCGKPVYLYTDFLTLLRSMGPTLAEMRYFKMNLRKIRLAHVGNFNRYRHDYVFRENFLPQLQHFYSEKNTLNLDVNQPIMEIMNQLEQFRPDIILSYPTEFQHLAYLKKKGYGDHVNPKLLQVGGDILDNYMRSYVENAFGCKLLNVYPSVEAQTNIAFECLEGNWHIHTDFFHLEAIDKDYEPVAPGERGHLVITRLWGKGTPIVRYTGMDDWVTLSDNARCSCGLHSEIFDKPVEGRMKANIILPGGKVFPPGAFCFVEPVLHDLQTFKIQQYQIVQKSIHEIEILLVVDDELRTTGPSLNKIIKGIQHIYQEKTGPDVITTVREVSEIKADPCSGKPAPIVVSHVTLEEGYKNLEESLEDTTYIN